MVIQGQDRAAGRAAGVPEHLAEVQLERIMDVDVREELRAGEEPFRRIMAARRELEAGDVLRLRATFEPVPLYAVMAKQGFDHWTEQLDDEDWRVWFYPNSNADAGRRAQVGSAVSDAAETSGESGRDAMAVDSAAEVQDSARGDGGTGDDDGVVILDVRGMEPPEPMVQTLELLERLPVGKTLLHINVRVPRFLLPQLEDRGFAYEIHEQRDDLVRVFIRRAADAS